LFIGGTSLNDTFVEVPLDDNNATGTYTHIQTDRHTETQRERQAEIHIDVK